MATRRECPAFRSASLCWIWMSSYMYRLCTVSPVPTARLTPSVVGSSRLSVEGCQLRCRPSGRHALARPSPGPLARHHDSGGEQFATPDTPRLVAFQCSGQASRPDRAVEAEGLGLFDIRR
jgi:hypothetical protein